MTAKRLLFVSYLIGIILNLPTAIFAKDFSVSDIDGLRQAIQEANGNGQADVLILSPGTYNITGASHEDGGSTGDLDIRSSLTLRGDSPRDTILLGDSNDRILDIVGNFNVQIENITIQGGKVTGGSTLEEGGGGILVNGNAIVTIENCILTENINDNLAFGTGGAIFNLLGHIIIHNSLIFNNTSVKVAGGAITQVDGKLELVNSTISENFSSVGAGGIQISNGTALILNSTITKNSSESGGVEGIDCGSNDVTIGNTVIADNDSAPNHDPDVTGTFSSLGGNIIGNNGELAPIKFFTIINQQPSDQVGSSNSPIDAMLDPLQNNGGDTDTHALLPSSPALNNGENANCPSEDQRGVVRPLGDKCDIGAFEEGCGDGTKETNEECDDDNNTDGDGCSSICKLESNGNLNDPNGGGCSLSTHPFRPNHDGLGIIFVMTLFGITILRKRKT